MLDNDGKLKPHQDRRQEMGKDALKKRLYKKAL